MAEKEQVQAGIQTFIDSLKKTHSAITVNKYKNRLILINKEISLDSNEDDIWKYIEGTDSKLDTKRSKQFLVKTYRSYNKLPIDYFSSKLKKNTDGTYIESETPTPVDKKIKVLPLDYKELINNIANKNHKLLLRMLTEYDEVLRCDLVFVKNTDIKDGIIIIKETTKTKKEITIKLRQDELDLIDFYKEYIIHFKDTTKDRSNAYTKLVKRITKKYLGIELTQTDFRHIRSTKSYKEIEHLPVKEQQVLLVKQAKARAHSARTAISNYIDKTDDINVSLDHKKIINILKNDKIIETFDLLEVIKVMRLFRGIKEFLI